MIRLFFNVSRYIKKMRIVEKRKDAVIDFNNQKKEILKVLLKDKTINESTRLFDSVLEEYFAEMNSRYVEKCKDKIRLEKLFKNHKKSLK